VWMTEHYIVATTLQNILEPPTGGGYLCSDPVSTYYIFSTYDSIGTWYNIDHTKAAGCINRDVILDRVTLKQGKTHCRRGLIMYPIAHVVTDMDVDLE